MQALASLPLGNSFEIPAGYGFVVLSFGFMALVNIFLSTQVMSARKKYGVRYPNLYAPADHADKEKFDCIQRSHQNFLESWTSVAMSMVLVGLQMPLVAAALGAGWSIGRIIYGIGYASSGPSGRTVGGIFAHVFGDVPLWCLVFYVGIKMVQNGDVNAGVATNKVEL
eukprot:GEMP01051128.1.p1 GENE.GEMP01051128.1~~GEMP01051128.1.p1  ORF type:complete len:168 (+),score=27.80 GEMP01051128.1:248-751(+)